MNTNMKIRNIIAGAVLLLGGLVGCSEDFLDRPPLAAS